MQNKWMLRIVMFQNQEAEVVHESETANSNFVSIETSLFYFTKDKHKLKLNQYEFKNKKVTNASKDMQVSDEFESIKFIDDRINLQNTKSAHDFKNNAIVVVKHKDGKIFLRKLSTFQMKVYEGEGDETDGWCFVHKRNNDKIFWNGQSDPEKIKYQTVKVVKEAF